MSDGPGRYARWSAAALVGPLSAAAFTGSISWAAGHTPHKATTTSSTAPAKPGNGVTDEELNAQLDQVDALRQQVSDLKAQVSQLTGPGARPGAKASKGTAAPAAPRTSAPRVTRSAPAAHTSTGASSG